MKAPRRSVPARPVVPGARRQLWWRAVAVAVLLGVVGAAPARAGIYARNQPDGRCVVTASLPGVMPWDLRLERRQGGRWLWAAKPTDWSSARASARVTFTCLSERRARIRVRTVAASGQSTHTRAIRQPAPITPQVRVVYARPRDRASRADFASAVQTTAHTIQRWYLDQTGRTFRLSRRGLERCVLRRDAAWYLRRTYDRVLTDLQRCVPVSVVSPGYTWLIYVDVDHTCGATGPPLGVGVRGLAILPRHDLDGLVGAVPHADCGQTLEAPQGRWVGGAAHELGHAFGLRHPPECERWAETCDPKALMWLGYIDFPAATLTAGDRARLIRSPYFTSDWW